MIKFTVIFKVTENSRELTERISAHLKKAGEFKLLELLTTYKRGGDGKWIATFILSTMDDDVQLAISKIDGREF